METKKSIDIIFVKELPFETNGNKDNENALKDARLQFLLVLQYQDSSDCIGMHAALRLEKDDNTIVSGGATVIANIANWKESSKNQDDIVSNESIRQLISYSFAVMSGVFYKQSQSTIFNKVVIPYITTDELINFLRIEKIQK